ncbi:MULTISPECIES: SRPBCC family protein [Modicisalibacter]|uniref:SRPBCC family protein n=1 Tax=Modicisalibacter TaxID=574347 RepID=UPI00100B1E3B|nr:MULTISPECIES: SRPBCC family protein [Halomonadaceae]MBZ9557004.1 SRPBCC family protein [Modicisalibacter sp. R2A 31.J]MBZ9574282.1 SRPBCC family protein [Modicisalibacter sp. MOD 31.J]
MSTIEHSAILHAPPARVYALLERIENFVDYSDMIEAIEPLGDDRYRWYLHVIGRDWQFDVQVTERHAPHTLAWESLQGVANQGRYTLVEVPEGTRVELSVSYQIRNRLLAKAVDKAAKPLVNQVSRQILGRVEERL